MVQRDLHYHRSSLWGTILVLLMVLPLLAQPTPPAEFAVGVVASDEAKLSRPIPRTQDLTADAVLEMVRRAVELIGGMAAIVPDTARLVVIKPNIVTAKPSGSGVVTDARVVRAVAILVHEVAPQAKILIAEGSGDWMSPSLQDSTSVRVSSDALVDGFDIAGHRATVEELRRRGITIDCYDLNFDRVYMLRVPGGGLALDAYEVAATIIDADVWINCPVAKTHGAKITCCMKNQFGMLPGKIYGWNKARGTETHRGIPHVPRVIDEAMVDVWTLSQMDLNVVDMLAGTEGGAFEGTPRRSNVILAGRDPVATDLVAAKLMGFNPDDFEFADLAGQRGMGPGSIEHVDVRGTQIDGLITRFKKAGIDYDGDWQEQANFGMGPRRWILLGPLSKDHHLTPTEIAELAPVPGQDGWSPVIWFGHDKIDLDKHFDDPVNCAVYAFTAFTMTTSDSVRFWIGSDEGLTVWIDGKLLYEHTGPRRHRLGQDRLPWFLEVGTHRLLIRAEQSRGHFDFSFNICEPIDEEFYAGNRYPGVRYDVTPKRLSRVPVVQVRADEIEDDWYTVQRESTLEPFDEVVASRSAPDSMMILGVRRPSSRDMLGVLSGVTGLQRGDLDSVSLVCLGAAPFGLEHLGFGKEGWAPAYGPGLGRVFTWLGVRYAANYGYQYREALKSVKGWLVTGRVPVVGYGGGWSLATGYREREGRVELHLVSADTTGWAAVTEDWWALLPGGEWANCPVIVAEAGGDGVSAEALVDSVAGLALEMALRRWVEYEPESWGTRRAYAGLAAWDAWVLDWERLPWTLEWARQDWPRDRLARLRRRYLPELAGERRLAAVYFARAAERTGNNARRRLLRTAAAGYRETAGALQELSEKLPEKRGGPLTEADTRRLENIGQARPLVRKACQAERQALRALAQHLGRPDLPPAGEDPLHHNKVARKVFTWRASFSNGIYDLTLKQGVLQQQRLAGKETQGVWYELSTPLLQEEGWRVVVEVIKGTGLYQVVQQPGASNGGTVILRIDDQWAKRDNETEVVLWALPEHR